MLIEATAAGTVLAILEGRNWPMSREQIELDMAWSWVRLTDVAYNHAWPSEATWAKDYVRQARQGIERLLSDGLIERVNDRAEVYQVTEAGAGLAAELAAAIGRNVARSIPWYREKLAEKERMLQPRPIF